MQLCGLLIAFFASILASTRANVIGIDFASDAFKVAIVQPGTPLEIGTVSPAFIFTRLLLLACLPIVLVLRSSFKFLCLYLLSYNIDGKQ